MGADLAFARNRLIKQQTACVLLVQSVILWPADAGHTERSETVGWKWWRRGGGVGLITGSTPAPKATAAVTGRSEASILPWAIQTLCRKRAGQGLRAGHPQNIYNSYSYSTYSTLPVNPEIQTFYLFGKKNGCILISTSHLKYFNTFSPSSSIKLFSHLILLWWTNNNNNIILNNVTLCITFLLQFTFSKWKSFSPISPIIVIHIRVIDFFKNSKIDNNTISLIYFI